MADPTSAPDEVAGEPGRSEDVHRLLGLVDRVERARADHEAEALRLEAAELRRTALLHELMMLRGSFAASEEQLRTARAAVKEVQHVLVARPDVGEVQTRAQAAQRRYDTLKARFLDLKHKEATLLPRQEEAKQGAIVAQRLQTQVDECHRLLGLLHEEHEHLERAAKLLEQQEPGTCDREQRARKRRECLERQWVRLRVELDSSSMAPRVEAENHSHQQDDTQGDPYADLKREIEQRLSNHQVDNDRLQQLYSYGSSDAP